MGGCGAFGKLPAVGDFIRFGLPAGFVDPWDHWLQTGIAAARDTLGGRWNDCYLSAPIWRFSMAPGVVGGQGMIGVLMASVDRVGRQFPLTLAVPCAPPHAALHLNARPWFEQLEDIALSVLDDLPLEVLKTRLGDLPAPVAPRVVTARGGTIVGGADDPAPLAAPHFAAPLIWSARTKAGLYLMQGDAPPQGAGFVALFDLDAPTWQAAA